MTMCKLQSRFSHLQDEIKRLTAVYQRPAGAVRLIAVSKKHRVNKVIELAHLDQRDFAENYLQEGMEKITQTTQSFAADSLKPLCWHFIGHIQSRKCRLIAENFNWVHTIDNIKVANKLNQYRGQYRAEACASGAPSASRNNPLNVLIQLNLDDEAAKSGVSEQQLPALTDALAELPNLRLRGLMIIPKVSKTLAMQRSVFRRCRAMRDALNARGFALEHLSMGMSGDLEAAIAEGATMVRIGTALFGARD